MATDLTTPYTGAELFDTENVFSGIMRSVPAWKDLADAVTEVMNHQIEEPRRQLGRIRDPMLYRKDEIVSGLTYSGGEVTDTNGNPVSLQPFTPLPPSTVIQVIQNTGTASNPGQDYIHIEFPIADGRRLQWMMPTTVTVARTQLLQTAAMMGFDFFNSSLSDKDYHRIITYISQYYPMAGTEQFVNFIGFIKNISLKLNPLWSYDDGSDTFPLLESLPVGAVKATQGGPWYLTSHVELEYDPFANGVPLQTELSQTMLQELTNLFYMFAPIILVLERIVEAIKMDFNFFVAIGTQELEILEGAVAFDTSGLFQKYVGIAGQQKSIMGQAIAYTWPMLQSQIAMAISDQTTQIYQQGMGETDYLSDTIQFSYAASTQRKEINAASAQYKSPILSATITASVVGYNTELHAQKVSFSQDFQPVYYSVANSGQLTIIHNGAIPAPYYSTSSFLTGMASSATFTCILHGRVVSTYTY